MTQNTSLEIIIPQATLRYFYQDDDATFEIEDKVRAKNRARQLEFDYYIWYINFIIKLQFFKLNFSHFVGKCRYRVNI